MVDERPCIIVVAGPTGVGKTALAVALAAPMGGEILSADAMQVYRGLDIGTAKPTPSELAQVPHHLVDVVSPDEAFDAARFLSYAGAVITRLHEKGIPIFVVGGTGLYIKVLTKGLFETESGQQEEEIRRRLRGDQERQGVGELHRRLSSIDPERASRIHPNDAFRVIRALEVYERTGKPMSAHHREHGFSDRPYRLLKFGLYMDREQLYERINQRVEQMIATGLLEEVKGLLAQGYGPELKSMSSIGYRHMVLYLNGELTWEEAVETLKRDTRRYAKRQLTWFRADREVHWVQPTQVHEVQTKIHSFLTSCGWKPSVP